MDILATQHDGLYETLTPIQFHNLYLKLLYLWDNNKLNVDDEHYLKGSIKVDRAYQYAVDFLNYHYKDYGLSIFHVHATDPYYEFEDPNTQLGVANTWGGQNPGMTEKNMENTVTWPNGNTLKGLKGWKDAVKFNEFKKFIKLTNPNRTQVFQEMPYLEEIDCTNLTKLTNKFFYNCQKLWKVGADENNELPNLHYLESEVFSYCSSLEKINIPNLFDTSLTCNFNQCTALQYAHIDGQNLNTINNSCFYYDTELISVTGLSHLTKIGNESFRHCLKLTNVDNLDNVSYFGELCFYECQEMTDFDLTNAEYIYNSAFSGTGIKTANLQNIKYFTNSFSWCTSLKNVIIGENYTNYIIYARAFRGDTSLQTINLDNCIEIAEEGFRDCESLRSVGNTSNLLRFSGSTNFYNCYALESINLVNIKQIPNSCFSGCSSLSDVGNLSGVERIDNAAFYKSGIIGPIVLTNVEIFGSQVFRECENLTSLTLGPLITHINQSDSSENYRECTSLTTFIAPNLERIWRYDFYGCSSLKTVDIPEVTQIDTQAFYNCSSLETISLPKVTQIGSNCFRNTGIINFSAPLLNTLGYESFSELQTIETVTLDTIETIEYYAFYNCKHLNSITMPNVKTIQYCAFEYCELLPGTINIPNIENLGNWVFDGCKEVTSFNLGNKIKIIPTGAFRNCEKLTSINTENWESVSRNAMQGCIKITSLNLSNLKTLTTDVTWNEGSHFASMSLLKTVTSLQNLESINGNNAFYNCIELITAPLSNKISILPGSTFENCVKLENVGDLTGLVTISAMAFYHTYKLNYNGNLPNVEYIGKYAFAASNIGPNLNLPKWSRYQEDSDHRYFASCANIETVNIPALNIIPVCTFTGCIKLETVTLSENLTEIKEYAFQSCSKLNNVVLPATVTILKNGCFSYCSSLKVMTVKATTPPECPNGNPFSNTSLNVIYVPTGSVSAYQSATYWNNFNIQPISS